MASTVEGTFYSVMKIQEGAEPCPVRKLFMEPRRELILGRDNVAWVSSSAVEYSDSGFNTLRFESDVLKDERRCWPGRLHVTLSNDSQEVLIHCPIHVLPIQSAITARAVSSAPIPHRPQKTRGTHPLFHSAAIPPPFCNFFLITCLSPVASAGTATPSPIHTVSAAIIPI